MDQKLLQALNNVGLALESLVDALESKKEASNTTTEVMKSGNFGKQLEVITAKIGEIKSNTEKILKNQETIIAISKEKESDKKTKDIEEAGGAKKNADIKKGVGTILLIATAVLAIGLAFRLVGDVNVLSVISLALAITIIATAFEKVALMGISIKDASIASLTLVMISIALSLSSYTLSYIRPISVSQFLTASLISMIFVIISNGIGDLIKAFKGMDIKSIVTASIFLPIILPAISFAIAGASYALQLVQPIGLIQFFSAVMIGLVFVVLAFGLKKIIESFKGLDPMAIEVAAVSIPILMIAMSVAIWASSQLLSKVTPITFDNFLSALQISIIFIGLSFSASLIIKQMKDIDEKTLAKAVIGIPTLMIAMSLAIWASSYILDKMIIVDEEKLKNAAKIGAGLAIISIAMAPTIKILSDLDLRNIIKGAAIIPIIATAITASSWILSFGKYDGNFPTTDWIKGVSLSLLVFGAATIGLGFLITASGGLGLPALALGGAGALIVAGTIAASSHLLKLGDYKTSYPGLDWAKGVSLSLVSFGSGMVILGGIIFASFGIGLAMLKAGSNAVLMVAKTIVSASDILANGYTDDDGILMKPNYKGGPTKEWADSISIALGAFSPIYGMLMKNKLLSFLGGGVGPEDFTKAIKTVSQGIVSAANFFASPENPGVWAGYPTKAWSEGIGLALGAFAPVYEILAANSGWLRSGVSAEEFAGKFDNTGKLVKDGAIQIISRGIVSAAKFFADNNARFDEGKYPSKNWGEGVGSALSAFSPVFDMLMEKSGFWKSGDSVINNMIKGIEGISNAIVKIATKFTDASKGAIFDSYPSNNWSNNVRGTIEKFVDLINYLDKNRTPYWIAKDVAGRIVSMAKILHGGYEFFSKSIDPNYISNVSQNMLDFNELVKKITDSESEGMLSKFSNNLLGTDPIMQIARRMITLAEGYDKLADSLTKLGVAMKTLNITDVKALSGLTKELVLTDGLSKDNSRQGISQIENKTPTTSVRTSVSNLTGAVGGGLSGDKKVEQQLNEIIKLLTNIDKSSESLDSLISQQIGDEDPKKETNIFGR